MGYLLVSAVLVVSLGRLGDIYGRVAIYNAGFLVFSLASVFLAIDPLTGGAGALWLIARSGHPGHRRRDADGQLERDRDRRLSVQPARLRPRHQHGRGPRPARSSVWSPVVCSPRSAGGWCSGSASRSACSVRSGPTAASRRSAPSNRGPDRLVGQPDLRRRTVRPALRHHVRHPAVRRQEHGLDQPMGRGRPHRRSRHARRLLLDRDQGRVADVPPRPVQDAGVRGRQLGDVPVLDRPRWTAVHADHLAAGHLAPAARLLLRGHPAVGRHLSAAADRRLPDRRSAVRLPVRQVRRPGFRQRRTLPGSTDLWRAAAAADRLLVRLVRRRSSR